MASWRQRDGSSGWANWDYEDKDYQLQYKTVEFESFHWVSNSLDTAYYCSTVICNKL